MCVLSLLTVVSRRDGRYGLQWKCVLVFKDDSFSYIITAANAVRYGTAKGELFLNLVCL